VVEVSQREMQQLGIQWGTKLKTISAAGLTLPSNDNGFSTIAGGLGVGIIESGIFRELITALATDALTNILSTPSLVVLDNQPANIAIGQKLSTTTGSYPTNSTGSTVQPFTTTNYLEVALHLNVTPQINRGNSVLLKIDQGDDTPSGTIGSSGNPNINTSSIKTSVMINSGQILVLGGLMSKDIEETDQKIPLLGDVPVLGKLFHNKNKSLVNKNLLVFIRPTIMHEDSEGLNMTSGHYNIMRNLQKSQNHLSKRNTVYEQGSVLPAWDTISKSDAPIGNVQNQGINAAGS
jgi:general secretion pathway protein D